MGPIPLRAILGPEIDPSQFKLYCAVYNSVAYPIDVLSSHPEEWVRWNSWREAKDTFNRQFIFSLAQDHNDRSRWLFGGIFEVLARRPEPRALSYDVTLREDLLGPFTKRLVLRFTPPGRNTRLNFEAQIDNIVVDEILGKSYEGAPFPGHDQINHTLAELQLIIEQNRPDWRIALQQMKGVYAIHDQLTGEPYVGSAYGDTGVWDRWSTYAQTLHGGNVGLKKLVESKGAEYVRANLRFALLEYWSMRTDDMHVLNRETYWKEVLLSRSLGHNKN